MTLMYSAMKNMANFMAEYSVWYPATSSASASGRSKGRRLVSAKADTKKTTNPRNCGKDVPPVKRESEPAAALLDDDLREPERSGRKNHSRGGGRHRELVGNDLGARADAAHQGELVVGRPAREHDPVNRQRGEGEEVQDPDGDVRADQGNGATARGERGPVRDDGERGHRRERRQARREHVEETVRVRRDQVFLHEELDDVGQRLEETERADAVGARPVLDQAGSAPLHPLEHRQNDQDGEDRGEHAKGRDPQVRAAHSAPVETNSPFFRRPPPAISSSVMWS